MQDETIPDLGRAVDETEATVLWLLLRPGPSGLWSAQEIAREVGDPAIAELALAGLHGCGLVHRLGDFAFASRPAARFRDLTLGGGE